MAARWVWLPFLLCALVPAGLVGVAHGQDNKPREVSFEELGPADAEIFMVVDAADEEINRVRDALLDEKKVIDRLAFLDKQSAAAEFTRILRENPDLAFIDEQSEYAELARMLRENPELVSSIPPEAFPTSFRIAFRDVDRVSPMLVSDWESLDGVNAIANGPALEAAFDRRRVECALGTADLEAFFEVSVTSKQERRASRLVKALPGVKAVEQVTRDEALKIFRCYFAGHPDSKRTKARDLPPSLRLTLEPGADVDTLVSAIEAIPGVYDVAGRLLDPD